MPYQSEGRIVGARLCHFKSGSSELLTGHKDWITNHFVPKMKQNPHSWIDFFGYASPSGNKDKNLALSQKRIDEVEQHIKSLYPDIKVNIKKADGEADAASFKTPKSNNDGYWRAVLVRWWGVNAEVAVPLYAADHPDWMKRVYRLIPTAENWRLAADKVLALALASLKTPPPNDEQKLAMQLVDRIFKISTHPGQTTEQSIKDIERLQGVFREIRLLIQAITKGDQYLQESTDPSHSGDTAYTFPGNWKNKDPKDGVWYVKAKIENATDEFVVDATIHEFAHFCGPAGADAVDHAMVGGQPAYGDLALGLSKTDAFKNASSYAWLAYLARKPSNVWLTAK